MRLRDYQAILEKHVHQLSPKFEKVRKNETVYYKFTNSQEIKNALNHIRELKAYKSKAEEILAHPSMLLSAQEPIISEEERQTLQTILTALSHSSRVLYSVLNEVLPPQNPYSVSIKLPPISDLDELDKTVGKLKVSTVSAINSTEDGDVKLQAFDSGSIWIEIIVGGRIAISVFSKIINASIECVKKVKEVEMMQEKLRAMQIRNEFVEELKTKGIEQTKQLIQAQSELIMRDDLQSSDKEKLAQIQAAIRGWKELIIEGAEIFPAINAPEEIKSSLPDFNEKDKLLNWVQKVIELKE